MNLVKLKGKGDGYFNNAANTFAVLNIGTGVYVRRAKGTYILKAKGKKPGQYHGQFTGKDSVLKLAVEHKKKVCKLWWSLEEKEA